MLQSAHGGFNASTPTILVSKVVTVLTDAMVKRISKMTTVEELDLQPTMLKLTLLKLERTSVTDIALEHLSLSSSLTTIVVRNTNVTAEGVARLREALPNCEVVSELSPE